MRIRFFTPVQQQLEAPIVAPKHVNEESMEEVSDATTSVAEDSTAGEDSNLSMSSSMLEDDADLPEMDENQAGLLKRLLLSPLEPDMDF
mgnify:CR=1 FL=1